MAFPLIPILAGLGAVVGGEKLSRNRAEQRQQQAQMDQATGLRDVLSASGVDTRAIPGIGGALMGPLGGNVAEALLQNPNTPMSEGMQGIMDEQQARQQGIDALAMRREEAKLRKDQLAAAQTEQNMARQQMEFNQAQNQRLAPVLQAGRDIGVIQDIGTLLRNVGTENLPTTAKGALEGLRFRGIDIIRRTTEAGALQAAEIELFNEMLPTVDDWTAYSSAERYARLNELEYWLKGKVEDQLALMGDGLTINDLPQFGRSFEDIISPGLPEGFERGLPEPGQRTTDTPRQQPAINPGFMGIPLGGR